MDTLIADYSERIRAAAGAGGKLRIRGGGTKDFYGEPASGETLDTRPLTGIVAYEPTELVVTVRAGTPLAELEAVLNAQGQCLAFEPPHFGPGATVGGMVAAGLSGPRRMQVGALRDFVLGVKLVDGQGDALVFGGQVMKNVAGFDVSRLIAGSLGTLGLIVEVSLKVLPKPVAEATLRLRLSEAEALDRTNEWGGQPLPISATAFTGGELGVRLSGARAAVDAAGAQLGGEKVSDEQAAQFWADIREQRAPFFAGEAPLWRLSVPTTAPPIALPGQQLIEWGGGQRWWRTDADAEAMRAAAKQVGGHATRFRGVNTVAPVFTPLDPVQARLHRNLKQAFDPRGVFNPGRMYADF